MPSYKIVRFYQRDSESRRTVRTGLTLEEAQRWCQDPETSSSTATMPQARRITRRNGPWFDGYEQVS